MRTVPLLLCLIAGLAPAQTASPMAFEVASIRVTQGGRDSLDVGPASLTLRNSPLQAYIRFAYGVQDFQIAGPGWITEIPFDLFAKAGGPVKRADLQLMLQSLLAERFHLTFHRQVKELPALVLTVGKNGHKLQPVDVEGSPSFKTGRMSLTGQGATVGQLTEFLSGALKYPVIDQTGLTGLFNYTLDINRYVTEEMKKNDGPPPEAPSIVAQAVQAQLGLRLDSKKLPVEMLIVDHAEKVPVEN